jgi:cellulose synthase/poly-beta-1,6-N-acetylglucosamine synthase-like glycosyltransferase
VGTLATSMSEDLLVGWTMRHLQLSLFIAMESLSMQCRFIGFFLFPFLYPPTRKEYTNAGYSNVQDYLFLSKEESAKEGVTSETISLVILLGLLAWLSLVVIKRVFHVWYGRQVIGAIAVLYIFVLVLKLVIIYVGSKQFESSVKSEDLQSLDDDELPVISALIPLHKEKEILPQLLNHMSKMDYPKEKFDVIFILESTDEETIRAFVEARPPRHFKALLSPNVLPKTKPKALNVAFQKSKGDVVVIYDAETLPDVDQLKKAAWTLKTHPEVMYLHTRLDHYNTDYNWITKNFNAEYSYYYDHFFPGVISLGVPVPISGHSIYFRRHIIESVHGWDSYNVAEDCDIGIRLYRHGFGSGRIMNSFSLEQATTTIPTWIMQRVRWMKGFIQTSVVHLRYPLLLKKELGGWFKFSWFLYLVPFSVIMNILNMVLWVLFFCWNIGHPIYVKNLYGDSFILYASVFSFLMGNYIFLFFNFIGLYGRKRYAVMKWAFLSPVYWLLLGYASLYATYRFLFKPFQWEKTTHMIDTPNVVHATA